MSDLPPDKQGPWRCSQHTGPPPSPPPPEPRHPSQPSLHASSTTAGGDTTPSAWRPNMGSLSGFHDTSARSGQWAAFRRHPAAPPVHRSTSGWGVGASRSPPPRHAAPRSGRGVFSTQRGPYAAMAARSTTGKAVVTSTTDWRRGMTPPAIGVQTIEERRRYDQLCQDVEARLPAVIGASQCDPGREYAQFAGGFVETTDALLACICPANLVGKPCLLDFVSGGCPMIRLCGQLEKWTPHVCPDKGFRTILDTAEDIPASYSGNFGAITYYDSSDSESGGAQLSSEESSEDGSFRPGYRGQKVSFNDFSCGVQNSCGHIHWEVEINCRYMAANHVCKQVLEKGRLCSVGHDLEAARQAAREAVHQHERAARVMGAAGFEIEDVMGSKWVY